MTVIANSSGHMMSQWAQKVKSMFMLQVVEKISPKIVTGINVTDLTDTSKSCAVEVKKNTVLNKADEVYAVIKNRRSIARLVADALKQLKDGSDYSAKNIKRLIVSKHAHMDERLLEIQIEKYIKKSLVKGNMNKSMRSLKLRIKHGDRLKKWAKEGEDSVKEMLKKTQEKEKVKTAGNNSKTPKPDKPTEQPRQVKDASKPAKRPPLKDDKDKSAKKPKIDKSSKKVPKKTKPAGGKPNKTTIKDTKPKRKVSTAIKLTLRPNPPHPKTMKKTNVMSAVSNMKIRKLQQPMERARQHRAF